MYILILKKILLFLPGFLMHRVLVAEGAVFLPIHSLRVLPFVFGVAVVSLLADFASQCDYLSGHISISLLNLINSYRILRFFLGFISLIYPFNPLV